MPASTSNATVIRAVKTRLMKLINTGRYAGDLVTTSKKTVRENNNVADGVSRFLREMAFDEDAIAYADEKDDGLHIFESGFSIRLQTANTFSSKDFE